MKKTIGIMLISLLLLVLAAGCSVAKQVWIKLDENFPGGDIREDHVMTNEYYTPSWTPYHSGFVFNGWYYDKDGTEKYETTKLQKDTTLFGSWSYAPEKINVECTFDLSKITLAVGDNIKSVAIYDSEQGSPQVYKVTDTSMTEYTASFQVMSDTGGKITATVVRGETEIGYGEFPVDLFVDGKSYKLVVKPK